MEIESIHADSAKQPKIYAYTTAEMANRQWTRGAGIGWIKVGYTDKPDANDRVSPQLISLPAGEQHYELLHVEPAFADTNTIFTDKQVHKVLREQMGRVQLRSENGRRTEWFECSLQDVKDAIAAVKSGLPVNRSGRVSYEPRAEQIQAVRITADYFRQHACKPGEISAPHFLWNAKMRFGKTFTTYLLAREMGWKRILILTYKPAVREAWRSDLFGHTYFDGWQFVSPADEEADALSFSDSTVVCFASFQYLHQKGPNGRPKPRLGPVLDTKWDCIVLDEYHYGAWRDAAKEVCGADKSERVEQIVGAEFDERATPLSSRHFLYLSGTPFRALSNGEFLEDQIYNWTYTDEQSAKLAWQNEHPAAVAHENPWGDLPRLVLLTYKMPEELRGVAHDGEFNEFDLNTFFRARRDEAGIARFEREHDVQRWLQLLQGRWLGTNAGRPGSSSYSDLPFANLRLKAVLRHTLWFLPDVASCEAMERLLHDDDYFTEYEIVLAAGESVGIGAKALPPVEQAIGPDPTATRSITLTCGKLTTGVTVRAWSGVFMLRDTTSPEAYFQTAFRAQSPWTAQIMDGEYGTRREVLKDVCYVLDFAPIRAFEKINDYATRLAPGDGGLRSPEERVQELLNFLPVLAYDGLRMEEVDCGLLLDVVATGIGATMLARKWTSALLVDVNRESLGQLLENDDLVAALGSLESFSNLNISTGVERILNNDIDIVATQRQGQPVSPEQEKEKRETSSLLKELRANLIKLASRLPVFMYLTEHREASLVDLVRSLDGQLFTRVTGLSISDFEQLCSIGLFNARMMDDAVLAFRRFEQASLTYLQSPMTTIATGSDSTVQLMLDGLVRARARIVETGRIVIQARSFIATQGASSEPTNIKELRERLVASGEVEASDEGWMVLLSDLEPMSPSAAAMLVAGYSMNGRVGWKTSYGQSFGTLGHETSHLAEQEMKSEISNNMQR